MKRARLIFLSLLFVLLFNEPVISIVNQPVLVAGLPMLYAYVLGVWACMIGLIALVLYRSRSADDPSNSDE
ncbi:MULTISPECIES: hypothetical protein [unclassified Spirosoma]|uniref:hypothetical protein n=1 Tax=unclassified Spirosoma TaxID=2621999 RepID=UPI00095F9F0C|nr:MULTISPECIES: hypothetical protein [unclassified Spirosoma]MBN8825787.1 hypothetical protein [Spirosoma sp.]OJW74380.1 MAG: hypothetical protein BGO59_19315 [Spirosoma sp. 48-14]